MQPPTVASITESVGRITDLRAPVNLIKAYKGTMVKETGRIVAVNRDSFTIQAEHRLPFDALNGLVHLHGEAFPEVYAATINVVDGIKDTFEISDLHRSDWQDRQMERVQPKTPVFSLLHLGRKSCRARIEDVCPQGVALVVSKTTSCAGKLQLGARPWIEFQLDADTRFDHLKGSIIYKQDLGRQLIKLGLQLLPTASQQNDLLSYVLRRQVDIYEEMDQATIRLHEHQHVEDLFF